VARSFAYNQAPSSRADAGPREARLEIRLTHEQKALLTRAAAARGATVADFVRQSAQAAAVQVVAEHDVIQLCVADQQALATALLTPREPSERLKTAYREYREKVGD